MVPIYVIDFHKIMLSGCIFPQSQHKKTVNLVTHSLYKHYGIKLI